MLKRTVICTLLLAIFNILHAQEEGWTQLLNGKNLDGWKQLNGEAKYKVENGEIVGVSVVNTPNSFLCTEQNYSDFILEFEVKVDAGLNSGVQFRSNSTEEYRNGRVHGYQAEIDPSARAYSGGIYDEARRGWLYPLSINENGRKAFRNGEWNAYRIEAIGNDLRVWINGINTALVHDNMTSSGFIGLQVHGIGDDKEKEGSIVKWRNIRIKTSDLEVTRWRPHPDVPEVNLVPNTLTNLEKHRGWRFLWDGKTTQGWRGARLNHFPEIGWQINDGVLTVLASGGAESAHGGDIITEEQYSSFILKLDFRITEGANSGIKYFVDPQLNKGEEGSAIGLEYQILDDDAHPDADMGVEGNRTMASLYDLIPAKNLSRPSGNKRVKGPGEWNTALIVVDGNHIEHWLNEFKVVEYERNTPMYRALVAYSKYKVWPNFGESPAGHILLQDHGNEVSFRSIKIKIL